MHINIRLTMLTINIDFANLILSSVNFNVLLFMVVALFSLFSTKLSNLTLLFITETSEEGQKLGCFGIVA